MEAPRAFPLISNGIESSGCLKSNSMDYKLSKNSINGSALNSEKMLDFCSQSYISRLNESFMPGHIDSQSLLIGANGHNMQPSAQISQCATSSNFPRFPHPNKLDEERFQAGVGINPSHVLQPRINPVSRRTRHFVPNDRKDEYYWQKRRKNNEAARKSREKRRTIDSVLEEKVLILSHENKLLRNELYALKVKYGEIASEKPIGSTETTAQEDKVKLPIPINKPSALPSDKEVTPCSCACPKSPIATSPALTSPTAITLPKVNVILESDKLSGETASSAKLVLTNLASGTLILSPINLSCGKAISEESQQPIENGRASIISSEVKPEELKEVEAANTLANLFRCVSNGNGGEKQQNGSLSEDSSDTNTKDSPKCKNLPCKLRFKGSKMD